MRETCGRALIIILSAIVYFQFYPIDSKHIAIMLVGVMIGFITDIFTIFPSLFSRLKDNAIANELIMSAFLIACFICPPLFFFTPGWAMCSFSMKIRYANYLCLLLFVVELVRMQSFLVVIIPILAAIGVIIENLAISNVESMLSLRRERDYAREYEMVLKEKNRVLTENQDNKIYTATLQERNRIAREIHDNVGHMLTRSLLQIGAIKVINKDEKLAPLLTDLHETLDVAMNNIRSSVHDLHDESIDLESAIMDIKDSVQDFNINVSYDMKSIVPKDIKYAFIAIVKEATSNAIKHSNGDTIEIVATEQPGFYQLSIWDNGKNRNIDVSSGMGLSSMNNRVKNINGNMKITTDQGFKILVTVMK